MVKKSQKKRKSQKKNKAMDKKGNKKKAVSAESRYEKLDLKNFRDISTQPEEYRLRYYTTITGTEYEKQVDENTGKVTYKLVRKLKEDKN